MTPRQADLAFVLESVAGVRALYAIERGTRASASFDFALALDHGGGVIAAAHYAMTRVLSYDDCARVYFCKVALPASIAEAARPLVLTSPERDAARSRVPPPPPLPAIVVSRRPSVESAVLIVDDDSAVEAVVRTAAEANTECVISANVDAAVIVATARHFDLILCAAGRAFGLGGLLAKLPLDLASRVFVLAEPAEVANARWRLQGTARILGKPLDPWLLQCSLARADAVRLLWEPDLAKVVAADRSRRRVPAPTPEAPFSALLADVDEEVHEALRRIFRGEARHVMKSDPEAAAETALSTPFHTLICSAKAALHPRSFLDGVAREDPAGADRALVVAPARDVSYVKHKLAQMHRKNTVMALPIDDTTLRHEVFRDHPALATRVAVADAADAGDADSATSRLSWPRLRRIALLVVDDDPTTQILFAAADPRAEADVALATTSMDAFEHVLSQPVDVLVVSATMRGDGGEPFYRVLWRLKPELKSRSVLVVAPDLVPPSAPQSRARRIVVRPLTRDAIGQVVDAFARR